MKKEGKLLKPLCLQNLVWKVEKYVQQKHLQNLACKVEKYVQQKHIQSEPTTPPCTIHWMPFMTQLWMNFNLINILFHLGNSFCKISILYVGREVGNR